MNKDVDDLDELELIDQLELEEGYSQGSHAGSDADSEDQEDDDEEAEAMTEEQYNQLKFTVVNIVTAMGGLEEIMGLNGEIEMEYVLGDDCLRCLRDLRKLWRQDEEDHHRVIPRIYAEINVLQTGLLPLLLKTADMGEKGRKIALACSELESRVRVGWNNTDLSLMQPIY
jgi:replication fork protection complex subunit Tof1/Swi1